MIRHILRKNCHILTTYGEVFLGPDGCVTNMSDLQKAHSHLDMRTEMAKLPNFMDTELFNAEAEVDLAEGAPNTKDQALTLRQSDKEKDVGQVPVVPPPSGPSDLDYYRIILELSQNQGNLNSAGYVDMEVLTQELRAKNLPLITGTRRQNITDQGRKMESFSKKEVEGNGEGLNSPNGA